MVKPQSITCETVAEDHVLERYVTGRLDPEESERFEAHYFACDRCWGEVQAALEVRAALIPAEQHPAPRAELQEVSHRPRARAWRRWGPPLAAAAVLVLVIGVLRTGERVPQTDAPGITRGAATSLSLTIVRSNDSIRVTWPVIEGAVRHRVRAFTGDGLLLFTEEPVATRFVTAASFADTLDQVFLQVAALDRVGAVLATSPLEQVPR